MLEKICAFIHNYFIKTAFGGDYEIRDGLLSPSLPLKDGQRFWIAGSDLNDGVYTYHEDGIKDADDINSVGLHDETFAGTICAMSVPPAVIALSAEVKEWVANNKEAVEAPYQSESFNGYSYTLKTGTNGNALNWQEQFEEELKQWRKLC